VVASGIVSVGVVSVGVVSVGVVMEGVVFSVSAGTVVVWSGENQLVGRQPQSKIDKKTTKAQNRFTFLFLLSNGKL
jgi:hypothetical protein